MTIKRYEENVYLKVCQGQVVDKNHPIYVFDQTIFFPESGGQTSDKGTINGIEVLYVKEKNGVIEHTLAEPLTSEVVEMHLDWKSRLDQMQQHCGEHIISGIIKKEYDGNNKGFHIGKEDVTIDIDCVITKEMLPHIEDLCNDVIYDNIEIEFSILEDDSSLPLRKDLTVSEDVRIVNIPGVDCVGCCGTHPSRTGEVGIIKLYKVEKNKGMSRLFFKCGHRALVDLRKKTEIVQYFNQSYSSDDTSLIERFEKEQEKNEILKRRYIKLNRLQLDTFITEEYQENKVIQIYTLEEASTQDMNYVVKKVSEMKSCVTFVFSKSEKKVMLSHDGSFQLKCSDLFKNIKNYGGKGGGNAKSAQGIFNTIEEALQFVTDLKLSLKELNHDQML